MQFVCVWFDLHSDMPFSCVFFILFVRLLFRALICIPFFSGSAVNAVLKAHRNKVFVSQKWVLARFLPRPIDLVCSIHQKFDSLSVFRQEKRGKKRKKESNRDWVSRLKVQPVRMVIITHHVSMLYENTYYRSNATICHEESEEPIWARFSRPIFVAVAVLHFRKRDVRDVDGRAIVIESKEKYRSVEWVKWNSFNI